MNYKILQRNRHRYSEIATAFIEGVKTVNMTKKQKVAFVIILSVFVVQLFSSISGTTLFAQGKGRGTTKSKTEVFQKSNANDENEKLAEKIDETYNAFIKQNKVTEAVQTELKTAAEEYKKTLSAVAVLQGIIYYISNAQLASVEAINNLEFGDKKMFSGILMGLTIFACLGCIFKLFKHFLDTERHDNVKAISGYFSYIGLVILFWFSPSITRHIAGLAEPINASKVQSLVTEINNGITPILQKDFSGYLKNMSLAASTYTTATGLDKLIAKVNYGIDHISAFLSIALPYLIQMIFYLLLGTILVTVLAIPLVVITVMIKVLLTVMIYGTQLVFLLAFIPGFDKLWQSMIINMLNILLWSPIFNAVITFIIAVVLSTMGNPSIIGILWMTVVAFILSSQAVTITTSAAGVLIQGAGAGMAGAMSSLGTMNATSIAAKGAGMAVKVAGGAIGGIGAIKTAMNINSMSKLVKGDGSNSNNSSNNSNSN